MCLSVNGYSLNFTGNSVGTSGDKVQGGLHFGTLRISTVNVFADNTIYSV